MTLQDSIAEPLPGAHYNPVPPARRHPVVFARQGKDFLKLSIRGAALQFVTFGFYRFWLTTDVRRHLWSHTSVDGAPLEYLGRGKELLIGFLFALAILTPIYLLYFLAGLEAERLKAFASIPLFIFFYLFGQFAIYRARRYRLTRTIWRGVRFGMEGSGWSYSWRASLWGLGVLFTLGALYPWRAAALERYKMRHTHYGDLKGDFIGDGWTFFKKGWWMWAICLVGFLALMGMPFIGLVLQELKKQGVAVDFGRFGDYKALLFIAVPCLIAAPFLWTMFRALEWRWWASNIRFGEIDIASDLPKSSILILYLKFYVILSVVSSVVSVLMIAIGAAVLEVMGISMSAKASEFQAFAAKHNFIFVGGMMAMYLFAGLVVGIVQRFFLQHELWRIIASSLTIGNVEAADHVIVQGDVVNALGEGLADSLDVAGF